jgi:hypothetical protein
MSTGPIKKTKGSFAFSSSVSADIWHRDKDEKAYEWWYFDALSDDGTEALVIIFLDNFIYSPRYNTDPAHLVPSITGAVHRFPAVSFAYFKDGRMVHRAVSEFPEASFHASETSPECRIGDNSFQFESADYGRRYAVSISLPLSGDRSLEAELEWLLIESDLRPNTIEFEAGSHSWNMVAARSDVTGRIIARDRRGAEVERRQFRGTGYHDHNLDNRWLAKTVRDWHWGRAHFADATAIFCRFCELGDDNPSTKLFVVQGGEMKERTVGYEEQNSVRDKFGIRYPTRLRLIADDDVRLRVRPIEVIDSSFYYLRFLSEFSLDLGDGKDRETRGITEFLAPRSLKYRWLNWLSDMRVGKNGKGPLI